MTDGPSAFESFKRSDGSGAVKSLASEALSVLATRRVQFSAAMNPALLDKLEAAVLDRNPGQRTVVLEEFRALRIRDEQIADSLIPEVARRMGVAWCEDRMSFADVTIGTARLQAMVRDLAPDSTEVTDGRSALIGVVVPDDETHTLGAMIVTAQLRRLGFSVRLCLGRHQSAVLDELAADRYDAVFVSAAHSEKVVKLADFVKKIRQVVTRSTPIIVGGSVVERGLVAKGRIGADHFTTNVLEALNACGLKTSHKDEGRRLTTGEMTSPNS